MINKTVKFLAVLIFLQTPLVAQSTFTKIDSGAIVNDLANSRGCCWGDYDNDGDLDLFVANSLDNFLYQNQGDLDGAGQVTFTRITSGAIVNDDGRSESCSWGDYDNDGDLDLFVANKDDENNFLYQNNGDGSFQKITEGAIVNDGADSFGASWGDYDNDGDLDLYVTNSSENNSLYQNNLDSQATGPVTFTRITSGAVVSVGGGGGCNWVDYDNDGDLDLFVAVPVTNALDEAFLFQNTGNGTFQRILDAGKVPFVGSGIASNIEAGSWGDYDSDGDLDLFISNGSALFSDQLYQNNGDGSFQRITEGPVVNNIANSRGSSWGDYDNDGDLDLFVATASGVNLLYQNNGAGSFSNITDDEFSNFTSPSFATSWGDIDNDGDLDLFVTNSVTSSNFLYQNNGNSNNWINIKCVGTSSNTSAIGTKVRVHASINGNPVQQLCEISAQTGFGGQNSLEAEFGLGDAAIIDSVEIEWPSATLQVLNDVPVNQFLTVREILLPQHTPIKTVEADNEIVVAATSSGNNFSEIDLVFRRGGETGFTTVQMSDLGNGSFQGTIPATEVTSTGLEYRIVARDIAGQRVTLPFKGSYAVQVHVSDGLSKGQEQPHGSEQSGYRIFSVPLDLDDKSPAALLEDDLGEYDDTRWRFSEYVGDNSYREFPEIAEIVPGKGYWFLVSEPVRIIDTGAGTSNPTFPEFGIRLHTGWNLIGNPFNFPIPVENIEFQDGSSVVLRTFTGAWNNPVSEAVAQILPWEGYAVFNEGSTTTLLINPDLTASGLSKKSQKKSSPKASPPKMAGSMNKNEISWSIQVLAQCQQARDVDNVVGVSSQASEVRDPLDFPDPPPIGEYISVYFPHPEWDMRSTRFCTDFRPPFSQGTAWEFEVKSTIRDRVQLTFAGLESVPPQFEVWLIDESLSLTQNLRENPQFALAGSEEHPKQLKLLVGKSEFIEETLASVESIPSDFELSQNFPNPFNPATSIRYGLPRAENVTLKIYNILGKEVATLLNNERKVAGNHIAIWDGRNRQGERVASGIYVYQLRAGDFTVTRKMATVR